ncbi:hypothetical protein LEL_10704 [Akanthomyces lecanii RCEF 1005]|uniref:Uncharacterized protein n=1 Tax=Akanthomyces lecanii RCEF 1005 TaxID=1081108 RepID=A0A167W230_CORDF|nr:hypothetical protein LEL_10704 [Akanthomyces lecanii RCEF 1005]
MDSKQKHCPLADAEELPPGPGPKLQRFKHYASRIGWLARLDEDPPGCSNESSEAYVFKVMINTELYALKVFYNAEDDKYFWDPYVANDPVSRTDRKRQAELHLDPFYAECRAYGQINTAMKQGHIQRDIAVPCFGFMFLDDSYRKVLDDYGVDLKESCLDGDSSPVSYRGPEPRESNSERPIRCTVKKLASAEHGITQTTIHTIRKDIQQLNLLKVYNHNVRIHNFCGGKLASFTWSRTEPHCFITADNADLSSQLRNGDLAMLEDVVDGIGLLVTWRTTGNTAYRGKLRRRSQNDAVK